MKHLVWIFVGLLALAAAASADWGDPIKWDQLAPGIDQLGALSMIDDAAGVALCADDFACTEPGWITDMHFAGNVSSVDKLVGFRVTFWSDTPTTPNDESHPNGLIYDQTFTKADPDDPLKLGWQQMTDGTWRIDIPQPLWFEQEGTATNPSVYWVGIQGVFANDNHQGLFIWRFADRNLPTWGDDAAFRSPDQDTEPWSHWGWPSSQPGAAAALYDGSLPQGWWKSTDMAFELSGRAIPEPGTIALLASGLAVLGMVRRRK